MKASFAGRVVAELVEFSVKAYPATVPEREDTVLHYLHTPCVAPVTTKYVCTVCGQNVTNESRSRGVFCNYGYVILSKEELSFLALEEHKPRTLRVEHTTRMSEINPAWAERHYYLSPVTAHDRRAYVLIGRALRLEKSAAVVTYISHRRQHLAILVPEKFGLSLRTLCYATSVRELGDYGLQPDSIDLTSDEVTLGRQLVDALRSRFDHQRFTDSYKERLMELAKTKLSENPQISTKLQSLTDALRASTEHVKKKQRA